MMDWLWVCVFLLATAAATTHVILPNFFPLKAAAAASAPNLKKHYLLFKVVFFLTAGIAYILALLNQGSCFDSLRWFESVREKYIKEKSQVERQSAEAVSDQKLQQTMALTLKRLETYQKVILAANDRLLLLAWQLLSNISERTAIFHSSMLLRCCCPSFGGPLKTGEEP